MQSQRLQRFYEWSKTQTSLEVLHQLHIRRFWRQGDRFALAYDCHHAYRTSAHLDRVINYQDRLLFSMQYFHGTQPLDQTLPALNDSAVELPSLWHPHPRQLSPALFSFRRSQWPLLSRHLVAQLTADFLHERP